MIAIDNSALIDPTTGIGTIPVNEALFIAAATFSYDSGAKTVTVTDASTITSPDTFSNANVQVVDGQGVIAYGHISTAGGNTGGISVSALHLDTLLTISVTMISTKGVQATGQANYVTPTNDSGSIGFYATDFTTAHS